jgi:MraZ protein
MLLTGSFVRAIDEKLRIAIPKALRDVLGRNGAVVLFVAPSTDGSLAIYTEESLNRLADKLAQNSPAGKDVRAFRRMFYARATAIELDRQGRVRIPPDLAQWANLGKDAVLLGIEDHMELWDPTRWEAYLAERQSHYDEIAEAAFCVLEPRRPTGTN